MLVVRVELHSARTGKVTEIGRMLISLVGAYSGGRRGNYHVKVLRKGWRTVQRTAEVHDYPRLSYNVWRLVLRSLASAFPEEKTCMKRKKRSMA